MANIHNRSKFLKKPIDFKDFVIKCFETLNPSMSFDDNWHIDSMVEALEGIRKGESNRLIINVPPRHLKSICTSVAWPAWMLGHDPSKKIIVASYTQHLSEKLSEDCRFIMQTDWFRNLFPNCEISQKHDRKDKFITTKQGFRYATSVEGSITGEGADILIADDPHNPIHINNKANRDNCFDWFRSTFQSRLNCKKTGAMVLVMQRLHEDDLTGRLLKLNSNPPWQHLSLESECENDKLICLNGKILMFRPKGLLNPKREPKEVLEQLVQNVGNHNFNAQYQQNPPPENQGYIQKSYLKYEDFSELYDDENAIKIHSWDLAFKTGEKNDYSVCTSWIIKDEKYYLYDVFRDKLSYPDLKELVKRKTENEEPSWLLIEDHGPGQSLIQELRKERNIGKFAKCFDVELVPILAKNNKIGRLLNVRPLFESGKVILPENQAHWFEEFFEEIINFPNCPHDDIVDSVTQMLNYVKNKNLLQNQVLNL